MVKQSDNASSFKVLNNPKMCQGFWIPGCWITLSCYRDDERG